MFSSSIKGTNGGSTPAPPVPATNPPFQYVEALYHFDGTNLNNASTGFTDQSPAANSFTLTTPLQGFPATTNNPFNSSYSIDCRRSDNPCLTIAANAALGMGPSSFTIEFWMFAYSYASPSTDSRGILNVDDGNSAGRLGVRFCDSTYPRNVVLYGASGTAILATTVEPALHVWNHIAFVRNGASAITAYVNGVAAGTATNSVNFSCSTGTVFLGRVDASTNSFDGLLTNLRLTKGVAVYTGNFTPPTQPLAATQSSGTNISAITGVQCSLLTFVRPFHKDLSTFNLTIFRGTGLSNTGLYPWYVPETPFPRATIAAPGTAAAWSNASFGGSIGPVSVNSNNPSGNTTAPYQYVVSPASANFGFGTANFTIDFWVYLMTAAVRCDFINVYTDNVTQRLAVYTDIGSGDELDVYLNGNSATGAGPSATSLVGQWVFVALSKTSTTAFRTFVQGVQVGTTYTSTFTLGATNTFLIGNDNSSIAMLSSVRIVKGSGLYSTTFSVPTVPSVSTGAQTTLLLTASPGLVDQTQKQTLSGAGASSPYISTTLSKFGTSSAFFDGTSTSYWRSWYYSSKDNSNIYFGTSDFTVECWVYASAGSNNGIFQIAFTAGGFGGQTGLALAYYTSNSLRLFYGASSAASGTTSTMTTASWIHVAVVRKMTWVGGTPTGALKVYINGISDSALSVTDSYDYPTAYLTLGGYNTTSNTWNGNIDEFRISKYAVYTANFIPPTAAFPNT